MQIYACVCDTVDAVTDGGRWVWSGGVVQSAAVPM